MSIDKDKLKALANLATQGDWERDGYQVCPVANQNASLGSFSKSSDAAYVAAIQPSVVLALIAENEALRMQVKELDLMFGRYLLGMRASVVEWQQGKGADAAMEWIWNGLNGPGELPPAEETHAQAYFDREVVKIEEGLEEVYAYRDRRRSEKAQGGI
ncbi:ead/Ea22-like family protein [Pseudomonas shirazica]|uniref:ead/Ea22-like family protein n=1 Tax=Pseudomonas shirazica TaxID=1940636 RepID=UPI0034D6F4BA